MHLVRRARSVAALRASIAAVILILSGNAATIRRRVQLTCDRRPIAQMFEQRIQPLESIGTSSIIRKLAGRPGLTQGGVQAARKMSVPINHFVSIRSVAVGSRNCHYFSAIQVLPGTNGPFFLHLLGKNHGKVYCQNHM